MANRIIGNIGKGLLILSRYDMNECRAMLDFADEELDIHRCYCYVDGIDGESLSLDDQIAMKSLGWFKDLNDDGETTTYYFPRND